MSTFKSAMIVVMTLMLASVQFYNTAAQTTHTVGGTLGWAVPSNGPSAYTTWASGQTFRVGDVLIFNFTSGAHTVAEVSQAAYGPCTTTNPISVTATGPARLTLNAPGTHYYICTVGSHCQLGQKLTINVRPATSATPAPAPANNAPAASPTASPTSSPTMAPTPSTTVTPPTSSPTPSQSDVSPPTPLTTGDQSPSGSTTPSPTGSTTLPPPSPSGVGSSYAVGVPFTLLAVALAFFY